MNTGQTRRDVSHTQAETADGHATAVGVPTGENWFAVQLRPNMRLIAERNLRQQGFGVFAPSRLETFQRRGRLKTEARPLFPGYLFVQSNAGSRNLQVLNSTRGVVRVLAEPGRPPCALPAAFMTGLLCRCDDNGLINKGQTLEHGDTVRIFTGPFAGLISRIEDLAPQQRLHLLISVMGREVRTTVPEDAVDKIPQPVPV